MGTRHTMFELASGEFQLRFDCHPCPYVGDLHDKDYRIKADEEKS